MVLAYLASTLYHAARSQRLKNTLRIVDHVTIYLLIAGTYTPFLLALPEPWPTWMLGGIWSLAGSGIAERSSSAFATKSCREPTT